MTPRSDWTVESAVDNLLRAQQTRTARSPLTAEWPELDVATAYQVQDQLIQRRVAQGERIIGIKLGLTSRAKQERMGLTTPLTAWLTDRMLLESGVLVPTASLIHPRVEPELVFVLGDRIQGPGVTAASAMSAVRSVHAGFEVIDSRFIDFKFALPDVIADNASASGFIVGGIAGDPRTLDLALEACVLQCDGIVVDTATGAAIQGHPGEALAMAANSLAERGIALEPGWIILTGGMTDAVPVASSRQIIAEFTHLGSVIVAGA